MIVKMCVTPTGEARNASIPLIFLLHCLCGSCPLLLHSQHFQRVPWVRLCHRAPELCNAACPTGIVFWGHQCWPSLSSSPSMASSHGMLLCMCWSGILPVGPASFPQFPFQYLFSCNSPGGNKLFCIVRNNITFSISCLPVELSLQIMGWFCFLQMWESTFFFRECPWTLQLGVPFSPNQGFEAFPKLRVNLPASLVSRLIFCPSSLFVASFPEKCQFCCALDIFNIPPVSATITSCNCRTCIPVFSHNICSWAAIWDNL